MQARSKQRKRALRACIQTVQPIFSPPEGHAHPRHRLQTTGTVGAGSIAAAALVWCGSQRSAAIAQQ